MYTAPDLCVNPGLNPNTFEQYVTVSDNTFLLLTLILVIGGVALGVFFSVFLRCISGMATRERAFHRTRRDSISRGAQKRVRPNLASLAVPSSVATAV
uniref:LapA_dom domain-containing protein n=1 Tax=Globodera pallida TaxID=36090 RepID=A0A183C9L6_GLOPA